MKRFALIATLAVLCCGISAAPGSAASFDDSHPCPASGPLLVCPTAQVGQPYTLQLIALFGCDTYWWEFTNGGLPPGLSMSSSGLITGTPSAAVSTEPWVQVHDLTASQGGPSWCGGDNKSQRQFVFNVVPGLSIQDQSVPGATVGVAYSKQLSAINITSTNPIQGTPASPTWTIKSGSLPAGITLSAGGVLSGTATAEGSYTFVVKATIGSGASDTETETLLVRQPIVLTSQLTAAKAEVGEAFNATQSATGGAGTFTWTISQGALPRGLTLGADGTVSGTPEAAGRYQFTITATDTEARAKSTEVTMVVAARLGFKTTKLRSAAVGVAYRAKIALAGGVAPTKWTLRGKLPQGVKFAAKSGTLLGTPRKAGTYRLTVTVVDALNVTAKKTLTLVVR